ncbi:MAG: hypothetical protein AB1349_07655 [Elusimicrobiota bacterium]
MRKNAVVILFFLFLIFLFFPKIFLMIDVPITPGIESNDIFSLNYPFRDFLSRSLKNWKLPLWTDKISCGYPLLAEGQGGFFYPLNIVLFWFLPTYIAYNFSIILTFLMAGLFTYLYSRCIGINIFGSLLS